MTDIELFKAGKWSRTLQFPTGWDELTAGELELVATMLIDNGPRQLLLLQLITGRAKKQGVKLPRGWETLLDFEQAAIEGLPLVDNLLGKNDRSLTPYPMLGSYYGPAKAFDDLTVGEFEDCEVLYNLYHASGDEQHLGKMAAALWRPLDIKKRKRLSYTGYEANTQSFLRRVSRGNLHAIYLWYLGCRTKLVSIFPDVFGGGAASGPIETAPDLAGFTRLIHSGAGPKNGTRGQIRATPIKEFLFDCQLAAEQAAEMEAEMKKK